MSLWKRYVDAVLCVLLLALPFVVLRAGLREPERRDPVDRITLVLTAWCQDLLAPVANGIADAWDDYVYLVHVRRDNDRLRIENARLRSDAQRYRDAYEENRRLRRLLQLRTETPAETIPAEVVAKDHSPFFRVIRLAIAVPDGSRLRVGMPVVTYDGLVGHINSLVGRYANVTLTVDPRSAVDAMIERTGARGTVHGTGDRDRYAAQIEYLERTDDVRVGDTVVSTGLGCRFPAGLLLGRVAKVTRRDFGLYQEAELTPAVDFSRLREVLVLATEPTDCRPGVVAPARRAARSGAAP